MKRRNISILLLGFMSMLSCGSSSNGKDSLENFDKQNPSEEQESDGASLVPFTARVNIQTEYATADKIIDDEWVAVGISRPYSLQIDEENRYRDKHSFRFELRDDDNSLQGYNEGETKGRSELSYCYATEKDFASQSAKAYSDAQRMKTVYHHGKGFCPQGTAWSYHFAIWVPDDIDKDVNTIFAQWHGMPTRTLATNPQGKVVQLTDEEFLELESHTIFANEVGYEKIATTDKNGKVTYKKGEKNGWLIEQGGYPPLAFGFNSGYFYIKANSDRRWFTDKSDRTNANVGRLNSMQSVSSEYKTSTLAYKSLIDQFPKDKWVEFDVNIIWTGYSGESEQILHSGFLDVNMTVDGKSKKIVNQETIPIGRNDKDGYYFKFGIYRTSSSTVPVRYNLAGFTQKEVTPESLLGE